MNRELMEALDILDKEKNNYVFSCIEYLQSMKPCVEPIKKKKKLDCF